MAMYWSEWQTKSPIDRVKMTANATGLTALFLCHMPGRLMGHRAPFAAIGLKRKSASPNKPKDHCPGTAMDSNTLQARFPIGLRDQSLCTGQEQQDKEMKAGNQ